MPPAYHSLPRRHFVTPYTGEPLKRDEIWCKGGRGGWGAGRRLAEGAVLQTIKYLLNCHLSSPPQRRGQGWWFALPRSSAGAIKMRRRLLGSVSVRSTDDASHRSYPALQATKGGSSRGNLPLDPVLLPFAGAKGRPPRRAVQTVTFR